MEFKTDGCRFEIDDKITVRQVLTYNSKMAFSQGDERIVAMFEAAVPLIKNWESDIVEDITTLDIDKETDRKVAELVAWVGTQVYIYMNKVEEVPKN